MTGAPSPAATDRTAIDAKIATAAQWLADHYEIADYPFTKVLREAYGLSFNDAVKAIAEATRIRARRPSP